MLTSTMGKKQEEEEEGEQGILIASIRDSRIVKPLYGRILNTRAAYIEGTYNEQSVGGDAYIPEAITAT